MFHFIKLHESRAGKDLEAFVYVFAGTRRWQRCRKSWDQCRAQFANTTQRTKRVILHEGLLYPAFNFRQWLKSISGSVISFCKSPFCVWYPEEFEMVIRSSEFMDLWQQRI